MSRLKVAHLIDGLTVGGAEMMLYKLVSRMDRDRFEGSVITFMEGGEIAALVRDAGVTLHTLGLARSRVSVRALWKLRRLLVAERPDVVMTWCPTANVIGSIVSQWQGSHKLVWNIRRSEPRRSGYSLLTALAIRLGAGFSRRIKVIVANSEAGRRAHEAMGYGPRAWKVIPNGFDCEQFAPSLEVRHQVREELRVPHSAPLIGIVGRYDPVKDHATFIRAAALLHQQRSDVHFLMVGAGLTRENAELLCLAPQLILKGVLHLVGARQDVCRLMAALDVFALTSHNEGFPNVVGEAMACGVPCVVTQTAGDAPIIVDDTGLVVVTGDPMALANALERLTAAGPEERQRLGRAGRERIRRHYSLDAVIKQYEDLCGSLV